MPFPFKKPPMAHQKAALKKAWPLKAFGLYHDMGTGKTYTCINLAAGRFRQDLIEGLLIICPTAIKSVWEEQLAEWMPMAYDLLIVGSGIKPAKVITFVQRPFNGIKVMVVGVEALSQGKAFDHADYFVKNIKAMCAIDEASRIKNYKAARTKKAIKLGHQCPYRLAMTGTPVSQGLHDLFSQMMFLDPAILGLRSYVLFRNMYCVMGGFEGKNIIAYQNQDMLLEKIAPFVDVVRANEVMDLPDRVYQKRIVEPTKEQLSAIKQLKDLFEAEVDGDILITETVLERLTRYQQIIGGHFPYNVEDGKYEVKPLPKGSPKLRELMDITENEIPSDAKIIIWARFRPEIDLIARSLQAKFGHDSVVEFHGGVDYEGRKDAVDRFRNTPDCRFFVSNQATGGMGLTLVEATYTIYYSNSFSYEDREQSERRNYRKGSLHRVTYIDIEANHPYDRMIMKAIKTKGGLATMVNEVLKNE